MTNEANMCARLEGKDARALERVLAEAVAVEESATRGPKSKASAARAAAEEILSAARAGIRIAPHAETRPLGALLKAAGAALPPEFQVDGDGRYAFYLVELTFSLLLDPDQFPLAAEFGLLIDDDNADPPRKTRPVALFPSRHDVTWFSADVEGAVGLDTSLKLWVPTEGTVLAPYLKASGDAAVKARMVLGPFSFQFRHAALEVVGESDHRVLWRYVLKSQLSGKNEYKFFLILKVAKETKSVSLRAAVKVRPAKRSWLVFTEKLPTLADAATLSIELAPA